MQGFLFIVALFFMIGTIVGAMEGPRTVIQDSLRNDLNTAKNMLSSAWNGLRSPKVVGEGQSVAMVPASEVNAGVTTTTTTEQVSPVQDPFKDINPDTAKDVTIVSEAMVPASEVNAGVTTTTTTEQVSPVQDPFKDINPDTAKDVTIVSEGQSVAMVPASEVNAGVTTTTTTTEQVSPIQDPFKDINPDTAKDVTISAWNGLRSSKVVGEGQSVAMVPTSEVDAGVMTTAVSHVALQASSAGFFLISNYGCTGNLITSGVVTSLAACSSSCQANSNCVVFAWEPATGYCYLKSAIPGLSCFANSGTFMYFNVAPQDASYGLINSFDCATNANVFSMASTLADCKTICDSYSTCVGFVVASGTCYMKSSTVNDGSQSSCTGSNFPFYAKLALLPSISSSSGSSSGSSSTCTGTTPKTCGSGDGAVCISTSHTCCTATDPSGVIQGFDADAGAVCCGLKSPGWVQIGSVGYYGSYATCSIGSVCVGTTKCASNAGTVAVAAGSTAASSGGSCFASTEQVTLESGLLKAISEVQVGDRVLTVTTQGEQVFSDVVYLPHGRNEERTTFAQISTESGRDLKMTMNHYLPAGACALSTLPMVTASQVTAGDCVQTVTGREQVVSVSKVEGKGIYTIIAMEELIVVNGIVATPYGGINPTLVNIYYNLHRLAYTAFAGKMVGHGWLQKATEGLWSGLSALAALSA